MNVRTGIRCAGSRWPRRGFFLVACALAASWAFATAQPPVEGSAPALDVTPFVGTYLATDLPAQAAIIDQAITTGTASMGPLRRSIGRRRLHAVNVPVRVLRILREGTDVITEFDGDRYVAPDSGGSRRGRDPEGKRVRVSYRVDGDTLHGRYVGDDGEKRIAFTLGGGGQLTMAITLLSDQLANPIRYRLPYQRR